jgi:uncharacterized protein (TIGR00661 family)
MRILYGVQATGNGHISRSREVIRCLKADGLEVDVVLSGRDPSQLWDMEVFEPYRVFPGLTFSTRRGRLLFLDTARRLDLGRFYADIRRFDARGYDLVITDFEPLTARIARRAGKPSLGIGHQYAFRYKIPIAGYNPAAWYVIRNFAPADRAIGLHWHHFDQPILPPIVPKQMPADGDPSPVKTLVYLPFEALEDIRRLLGPFRACEFFIYHPLPEPREEGHLHLRTYSREGFLQDLADCGRVITNAGFELASEALKLGRRILVKPLAGQMEQLSNAKALKVLDLAIVMKRLDPSAVERLLEMPPFRPQPYPDVARLVADWIQAGDWNDVAGLAKAAWNGMGSLNPVRS